MLRILCLLIALGTLAAGCGAPDSEGGIAARKPMDEIRLNLGGVPETLDPTTNSSLITSRVLKGLMEGLIYVDGDSVVQPAGAARWEHNEDFTEWTFHLRPEARWHNGDPVVAEDYVYGVKRMLTRSIAADYAKHVLDFLADAGDYYEAGGLDSDAPFDAVRAEDDHTLVYTLSHPTPFFPSVVDLTCWYPLHRKTIEEHGEAWHQSPRTYVGNGPFKLELNANRDRIVLAKADTYWDRESINWNRVVFYMIESLPTEAAAFETGEIDVTNKVSLGDIDKWKVRPEWNDVANFGTYYVSFQNQRPPFNDARVRKAFSLAIDRKVLTDRLLRRGEIPSQGMIPDFLPSARGGTWREHAGDFVGGANIEEARRLFAEAGFGPGNPFPTLEYLYDSADDHRLVGEQLQAMWKEAFGVDIRLQPVEWGVRLERGRTGDFMVKRNGWYGDYLDAMTFLELFTTDNQFNRERMRNARYDELIAAARAEIDAVKREDLMIEAERILVEEECANAPLFTYALPILVGTDIVGLERNVLGDVHYQRARRVRQ